MGFDLGYVLYVTLVCSVIDWLGYGMYNMGLNQPVVAGAIVGLLLGDPETGIVIGGTLQLVYMGVVAVGAAIPVNKTTATTVSVALCIMTEISMESAVALAVPVAVLGQLDQMLAWTLNSSLMHIADGYAEKGELDKMSRLQFVGSAIFFITKAIPIFLCIYFGSPFVQMINDNMPAWVQKWLTMATGMLPALGFGMLFALMYKPKYIPFFIIGFVMAAVFGGSLLAIALLGAAFALTVYFYVPVAKKKKGGAL